MELEYLNRNLLYYAIVVPACLSVFQLLDGGSCFHSEPTGSWAANYGSALFLCFFHYDWDDSLVKRLLEHRKGRLPIDDLEGCMVRDHGLEVREAETQGEVYGDA